MGEPKACPFCGATSISVIEGSTYRWRIAQCDECGAQAPDVRVKTMGDGTKEEWKAAAHREAIAAWNERTEPSRAAEGDLSGTRTAEGVGTGAVVVPMEPEACDLCGFNTNQHGANCPTRFIPTPEVAWLIEIVGSPHTGNYLGPSRMFGEIGQATRFARREDAQAVIDATPRLHGFDDPDGLLSIRPTEHMWPAAAPHNHQPEARPDTRERDAKDAERYRWLRENRVKENYEFGGSELRMRFGQVFSNHNLDNAIDRAIESQRKEHAGG